MLAVCSKNNNPQKKQKRKQNFAQKMPKMRLLGKNFGKVQAARQKQRRIQQQRKLAQLQMENGKATVRPGVYKFKGRSGFWAPPKSGGCGCGR